MKKIFLVFALLFSCYVRGAANENEKIILPDMGDSSGRLISPLQEKQLGEAFYRSLHAQVNISEDSDIQLYIQSIGKRLVANSDSPGIPFHFFVVLDDAINAFAGPGGYIGINSGLMLATDSESELASVLAHEIAHVTQRHLYRAFEAASQLSLPTAAAMLAAILLGTQSPELGLAAITAIQAGSVQFQIDFTRDNEQEADRIGMQTLLQSQFDPRGMPIFFQKLQQSSRYYGHNIPEFLRTHPVTASRIADTRGRADKYPYRHYPDSFNYLLAKAKLRVLTLGHEDADVYRYFDTRRNQGTQRQRAVARYGIGLIYSRKQDFKRADAVFRQLVHEFPQQAQFATALARNQWDAREYATALTLYEKILDQFPGNNAAKIEYIATLLKTGQAEKAYQNLKRLNYSSYHHPQYYRLLAETYTALDRQAESHRYMAEYYYAKGDTRQAITQIKLARNAKDLNFYLAAILDERLRFFTEEEIERKKDQ